MVLITYRKIREYDLIQQCRDGIESSNVEPVWEEQQDIVPVCEEFLDGLQEVWVEARAQICGGRWRRSWSFLEDWNIVKYKYFLIIFMCTRMIQDEDKLLPAAPITWYPDKK